MNKHTLSYFFVIALLTTHHRPVKSGFVVSAAGVVCIAIVAAAVCKHFQKSETDKTIDGLADGAKNLVRAVGDLFKK